MWKRLQNDFSDFSDFLINVITLGQLDMIPLKRRCVLSFGDSFPLTRGCLTSSGIPLGIPLKPL